MSDELTTAQVAERLQTPERTVRLWCKQGRFNGARIERTPRGDYWLIPAGSLAGFVKPTQGRPPKPSDTPKRVTGQKNASNGPSGSKKRR